MFANALTMGLRVSAMLRERRRPRRPLKTQNVPIKDTVLPGQHTQLNAERDHVCGCRSQDAMIFALSNELQGLVERLATDRCHDPDFGQERANEGYQRHLLANKRMACPVRHQTGLTAPSIP